MAYYAHEGRYIVWGNPYKASEHGMATMIYIFFVSKIYEFMDTFIMLLKGNLHQVRASHFPEPLAACCFALTRRAGLAMKVTLLHVYHHASISFIWWMITNTAPGGDAYFSAAINSSVHVIMYLYYLLAILLGKDNKARAQPQPATAPAPGGLMCSGARRAATSTSGGAAMSRRSR